MPVPGGPGAVRHDLPLDPDLLKAGKALPLNAALARAGGATRADGTGKAAQ